MASTKEWFRSSEDRFQRFSSHRSSPVSALIHTRPPDPTAAQIALERYRQATPVRSLLSTDATAMGSASAWEAKASWL